jgi:Raf kinase inhibitor-like YbhB/YbcL family protein
MKKFTKRWLLYFLAIDVLLIIVAVSVLTFRRTVPGQEELADFNRQTMRLTSPAFAQDAAIPVEFTCDGRNVRPPLAISGVPENAKTLALVMDDPDAPFGTWTHWLVWNLPATTAEITATLLPAEAVEGRTSAGKPGYGGPCPPAGTHRYFFKLYALDAALPLQPSDDVKALEAAMEGHVIDKAGLVGKYGR